MVVRFAAIYFGQTNDCSPPYHQLLAIPPPTSFFLLQSLQFYSPSYPPVSTTQLSPLLSTCYFSLALSAAPLLLLLYDLLLLFDSLLLFNLLVFLVSSNCPLF
uniref:Candidate secreted effector n=1 Tax=Meloidogyne incognita TaxID=6306 RepID=A0A914L5K1_MELIC